MDSTITNLRSSAFDRPLFRLNLVIIFVCLAGILASPIAAKNGSSARVDLSEMAGKWKGTGWGKRNSSAPREGVRCRLTAKYRKKNQKLSVSGKCAATSRTFTLLGHVAEQKNSNKMTGRWINPDGIGSINIAGRRTANKLVFTFMAKDGKTGRKRKYRTVWSLQKNGFNLTSQIAENRFQDIGIIRFRK